MIRYYIGRNSLQHVLKEGSGRSDQIRDSTSNKGCSCTACTPRLPADLGLDPSTEQALNPSDRWTLGVHGYEPVPTLDPMAPEGLLKFTSCNCHGDCSNRRCSCKKNGVMCISACGVCKGITCKNSSHDVVKSEEDRQ